jgi:hypothetical protein
LYKFDFFINLNNSKYDAVKRQIVNYAGFTNLSNLINFIKQIIQILKIILVNITNISKNDLFNIKDIDELVKSIKPVNKLFLLLIVVSNNYSAYYKSRELMICKLISYFINNICVTFKNFFNKSGLIPNQQQIIETFSSPAGQNLSDNSISNIQLLLNCIECIYLITYFTQLNHYNNFNLNLETTSSPIGYTCPIVMNSEIRKLTQSPLFDCIKYNNVTHFIKDYSMLLNNYLDIASSILTGGTFNPSIYIDGIIKNRNICERVLNFGGICKSNPKKNIINLSYYLDDNCNLYNCLVSELNNKPEFNTNVTAQLNTIFEAFNYDNINLKHQKNIKKIYLDGILLKCNTNAILFKRDLRQNFV